MVGSALLGVTLLAALAASAFWFTRKVEAVLRSFPVAQPPASLDEALARATELRAEYDDGAIWETFGQIEKAIADLTAAVAHGIDHVDRNEKRVRAIVTGAQRRFNASGYEDGAVDAEADSLPEFDGEGGQAGGLQPVPGDVGTEVPAAWAAVPGMRP